MKRIVLLISILLFVFLFNDNTIARTLYGDEFKYETVDCGPVLCQDPGDGG